MGSTIHSIDKISTYLGKESEYLLGHESKTILKKDLHATGPNHIDEIFMISDRNPQVLRNLAAIYNSGRLANTGFMSILPVDQGIEHTAGSSFGPNPMYFDPENIIKLAIEGECNAVATTFGGLALTARKYAHYCYGRQS